jgi:hypothetical protein
MSVTSDTDSIESKGTLASQGTRTPDPDENGFGGTFDMSGPLQYNTGCIIDEHFGSIYLEVRFSEINWNAWKST